jgi:hypothetical protein
MVLTFTVYTFWSSMVVLKFSPWDCWLWVVTSSCESLCPAAAYMLAKHHHNIVRAVFATAANK